VVHQAGVWLMAGAVLLTVTRRLMELLSVDVGKLSTEEARWAACISSQPSCETVVFPVL
jgi:hypothetical protein